MRGSVLLCAGGAVGERPPLCRKTKIERLYMKNYVQEGKIEVSTYRIWRQGCFGNCGRGMWTLEFENNRHLPIFL